MTKTVFVTCIVSNDNMAYIVSSLFSSPSAIMTLLTKANVFLLC